MVHTMPRRKTSPPAPLLLLLLLGLLLAMLLQTARAFLLLGPSSSPGRTAQRPGEGTRLWNSQPPKRLTISEQLKLSPNRWKRNGQPLEPGVGGIWPGKPDAKTYKVRAGGSIKVPVCLPLGPSAKGACSGRRRRARRRIHPCMPKPTRTH